MITYLSHIIKAINFDNHSLKKKNWCCHEKRSEVQDPNWSSNEISTARWVAASHRREQAWPCGSTVEEWMIPTGDSCPMEKRQLPSNSTKKINALLSKREKKTGPSNCLPIAQNLFGPITRIAARRRPTFPVYNWFFERRNFTHHAYNNNKKWGIMRILHTFLFPILIYNFESSVVRAKNFILYISSNILTWIMELNYEWWKLKRKNLIK